MTKKSGNSNLHTAKTEKNDEFYTQLPDIEKELGHYRKHFQGKVVFCNCDDPEYSDFFKYFVLNFKNLGLKNLITTHYEDEKKSYKIEVNVKNIDQIFPHIANTTIFQSGEVFQNFGIPLEGNGDFRSPEAVEILKNCDIVVTNPPFSLFREYVAQLVEYEKKFIIIGNDNAITYKEIFPLIKEDKIWLGYNKVKEFQRPDGSFQKFGNVGWYTNLETTKRNEDVILYKTYKGNEEEYPKYDNYDAINVDKVKDIPMDYDGTMGVPITFIDKYNPKQFEIIELSRYLKTNGMSRKFVEDYYRSGQTGAIHEGHPDLCYYSIYGKPIIPYMRILIKNKKL